MTDITTKTYGPWHVVHARECTVVAETTSVHIAHHVDHPTACDALPYGVLCPVDDYASFNGFDGNGGDLDPGEYRARYWYQTGNPDVYALEVESAPELAPPDLSALDVLDALAGPGCDFGSISAASLEMCRTAGQTAWFFNGDNDEPSADAYATLDAAQRAAVTDYEAGDSGPIFADVTYAWRPLDEARHDHWCLDVDGAFTGWMVWPVRLLGGQPK